MTFNRSAEIKKRPKAPPVIPSIQNANGTPYKILLTNAIFISNKLPDVRALVTDATFPDVLEISEM